MRYRYIVSAANTVKDTRSKEQIAADAENKFKESKTVEESQQKAEKAAPARKPVAFKSPAGIGPVYAPTHRWYYCPDAGPNGLLLLLGLISWGML